MPKPVRWGVLGAANFAREQMAPAIHAARGAELAALATTDPGKAEGFRAFALGIAVHESYDALLATPPSRRSTSRCRTTSTSSGP
jgi:predicted dehydrogenase